MEINFAREYMIFECEMAEKKTEFLKHGVSEEEFHEYYKMRKADLNRDLAYHRRTVPLNSSEGSFDEDSKDPLYQKHLEQLSVEMGEPSTGRFWWLDQIENKKLLHTLLALSLDELTLIDMSLYQGLSQEEIAEITGIKQSTVSNNLATLFKKMKDDLIAAQFRPPMNVDRHRRKMNGRMVMSLCSSCAGSFYNTPGYLIKRIDLEQKKKCRCDFCNSKYGFDYLIKKAPTNVRFDKKANNRTLEKQNKNGYSRGTIWRSAEKPISSGNN